MFRDPSICVCVFLSKNIQIQSTVFCNFSPLSQWRTFLNEEQKIAERMSNLCFRICDECIDINVHRGNHDFPRENHGLPHWHVFSASEFLYLLTLTYFIEVGWFWRWQRIGCRSVALAFFFGNYNNKKYDLESAGKRWRCC